MLWFKKLPFKLVVYSFQKIKIKIPCRILINIYASINVTPTSNLSIHYFVA